MNVRQRAFFDCTRRAASRLACMLMLLGVALPAAADLHVNATRVLHQEGSGPARVRIRNTGEAASLIQSWIDLGDASVAPEHLKAPLITTPPLFRLDGGKRRDIHVRAADIASLPTDRETLLWLNILEVPARKPGKGKSLFEHAVQWRLKVIHRPAGLPGKPEAAATAVQWSFAEEDDGSLVLHARNASAYYVSLRELKLAGQVLPLVVRKAQIPPYGNWTQRVPGQADASNGSLPLQVEWLDDQGFVHALSASARLAK